MLVKKIVGPALLGFVLVGAVLIPPTNGSASSSFAHRRGHYVVYTHRRLYSPAYYRPQYRRRVVIVGPSYRRHHRVVYVYRRPYYYRRYYVRHYVR